ALAVRVSGHVDNFLYKAEEDIVPHLTIQMYPGRDDETKTRLAQAVLETASKELKREKEHFSVSVVDVPQEEWKGKVYDKVLADKNTIIQPGYKM
ncbi:MAG: tautomerase family protein, partial [Treponema sp.]|nr:tautomerase family protein [Treponema sp.]